MKIFKKVIKKILLLFVHKYYEMRVYGKPKIFCIGLNKTGTTSIQKALKDLNIVVASESEAKALFKSWKFRDFRPITKFCRRAQAFQDSPFSLPFLYVTLDQEFPRSKFILTIRDSDEQWYNSITGFHAKLWGSNGLPPTKLELQEAFNSYKGRPWEVNRVLFNTPEDDPYEKNALIGFYKNYNENVIEYFKCRPDDLLILNLSEKGAYKKFVDFIGVNSPYSNFPWENKT